MTRRMAVMGYAISEPRRHLHRCHDYDHRQHRHRSSRKEAQAALMPGLRKLTLEWAVEWALPCAAVVCAV